MSTREYSMTKVAVIGAGSWGTTVANVSAHNQPTMIWARESEVVDGINTGHENTLFLPDVRLQDQLTASNDLGEVLDGVDLVVVGVPSQFYRAVLSSAPKGAIQPGLPVLNLSKGIEQGSFKTMTKVLNDVLDKHDVNDVGVLAGPNIAKEVAAGEPSLSVVAFPDIQVANRLLPLFHTATFKVYSSDDVIGCEIAGAVKNVLALAAGMADGLGYGANTKAALISRGLAEMTRLGLKIGGRLTTFLGLAGNGDLIATCSSTASRNYHVGRQLGHGRTLAEIMAEMTMVAEGVKSCRGLLELAKAEGVEMPIAQEVGHVLEDGKSAHHAVSDLMARPPQVEAETFGLVEAGVQIVHSN
jgi:glycerol-3-phosphate dehydrogenase (NAD(P)+)